MGIKCSAAKGDGRQELSPLAFGDLFEDDGARGRKQSSMPGSGATEEDACGCESQLSGTLLGWLGALPPLGGVSGGSPRCCLGKVVRSKARRGVSVNRSPCRCESPKSASGGRARGAGLRPGFGLSISDKRWHGRNQFGLAVERQSAD